MKRFTRMIRSAARSYVQGWAAVDPAVALGLFGTGVGMALPPAAVPSRAGR